MEGYTRGKPDTGWWLAQIRAGIAFRKEAAREDRWSTWRGYYRGRWQANTLPSNIFFRMLRTVIPRVYFRNPSVSVQSKRPGLEAMIFAQILGRVDNTLIRTMKVKKQAKMIAQDAFLFGTGIGKVGFGAQFTPTPDFLNTQAPTGRSGQQVEYHADVDPNMPWFLRTQTGKFIVPSGVSDLESAPWVAEHHRRPLDDVKNDRRLKNTADLTGSTRSVLFQQENMHLKDKAKRSVEMVDIYEIRDKRTGQIILIAPFMTDRTLLFDEDPLQHSRGVPYYDVVFNPDDEWFWGIPDSMILEPQQREINEIRTSQMYHRRMSLIKFLFKQNSITQDEITKLMSEDPLAAVEIKGDPNTDVTRMEMGDIPDGLMKMDAIVMDDVRENLGFGRNQFGEFASGSADRTAHEAEIVRMASEIRVDERRDTLADMIVSLTEDLHHVVFNHWQDEQVVDVVGPMGVPFWIKFTPQMLRQSSYEVKVDPDSSLPETRALRQQKAEKVYTILRTNPLVDPVQLTQYLLREMHGVAFDTMLRIPPGLGTQQNPMNPGQFGDVLQGFAGANPGLAGPQSQESVGEVLDRGGA